MIYNQFLAAVNLRRLSSRQQISQVIFITSETRSGSTWLSYVLGTHPQAAHLGEYYRPFVHPGHIACRLCEGRGLSECEILGGIEHVPISNAYGFALQRYQPMGINCLIDCSKDLTWLERILLTGGGTTTGRLDIKMIHLIRDPRGWIASERRRSPMTVNEAINRWRKHYTTTQQWIKQWNLPHICISYDQLCLDPIRSLRKLSRLIGTKQESAQYQYWQKEHHGLGGNGAALNNLINTSKSTPTTGDDLFYKKNLKRVFYDLRWRNEDDALILDSLSQEEDLRKIFKRSGLSLNKIDTFSKHLT